MGQNQSIGKNVTIQEGVVLGDNIHIGDDCYLDYGCIIRDHVTLGANSYVGPRCILGEYTPDFHKDRVVRPHPLTIGENALLRSNTVIYGDTEIGSHFQTGHNLVVREQSKIGHHTRIGTHSDVQGRCSIGNYVSIHSNSHIAQGMEIHDFVWIFTYVVFTNDFTPPSKETMPMVIEEYALVSTGVVCTPGVRIKKHSLVGAGAVVTKDVEEGTVVVGNPAKAICTTEKLKNHFTGEAAYPWPYHFDRGMPWEGRDYGAWLKENG